MSSNLSFVILQSIPEKSSEEIEKKRIEIVQEFVHKMILNSNSKEEDMQILLRASEINAFLVEIAKGSLIIILAVHSLDTLEAIQRLYLGGVLLEAIRKDLLSEKRRHHILQIVKMNGAKDGDIKDSFFDSLDFDVEICPADFQFCHLNLKAIRGRNVITIILIISMPLLFDKSLQVIYFVARV